jgi:murein DD-endopeptidase MepM/ murein hydrolase activator NlpD
MTRLPRPLTCLLFPLLLAPGPTLLGLLAAPAATAAPVPRTDRPIPTAGVRLGGPRPPAAGGARRLERATGSRWRWPLPGRPAVVRRFEPPATRYGAGHRGVDLAGAPGEPVYAAGAGAVVYAGLLAGRGVVSVEHAGGLRTTYEPVRATVHAGQRVAAGVVVGHLDPGHAGCPAPACLHWGLRRGDTYLDPLSLLTGPIRLLPRNGPSRPGPVPGAALSPAAPAASHPAAARTGRIRRAAAPAATTGALLGGALLLRRRSP